MKISILGASGYVGGELLRLLLDHPHVSVEQVTSERLAGKRVTTAHPNLRGRTTLCFSRLADLTPCDLLFAALPHGSFAEIFNEAQSVAPRIIDMSADFRLRSANAYETWYGREHTDPPALDKFVYGLPELHRTAIRNASYVTGTGCLATAAILGLLPLFREGVVSQHEVFIEA